MFSPSSLASSLVSPWFSSHWGDHIDETMSIASDGDR